MDNRNCSGLYVLQSITGCYIDRMMEICESPYDAAYLLLRKAGVAFLNAYYSKERCRLDELKRSWDSVNAKVRNTLLTRRDM